MLRPFVRLTVIVGIPILILAWWWILEPHRRSTSCRSFESCIGRGRHTYKYHPDVKLNTTVTERTLHDGTFRFDRTIDDADPDTLFLVLNRDSSSWSKDFRSTQRTAYDFLDVLISTNLNLTETSLSLMTTSKEEYEILKSATDTLPIGRTTIFQHEDTGATFSYADRHKAEVQQARRASIAALRNYLMLRSLQDESHVVWIDADVVEFSQYIVQTMIDHSKRNPDAGIITARCSQGNMDNYDKNAWSLDRGVDEIMHTVEESNFASAYDKLTQTRYWITDAINGTHDNDIRKLDSVGGTLLYVRADLVRRGVNFPYYNVVGATWEMGGWIGVETEGICYVANRLVGKNVCWALGGHHSVRHSDMG